MHQIHEVSKETAQRNIELDLEYNALFSYAWRALIKNFGYARVYVRERCVPLDAVLLCCASRAINYNNPLWLALDENSLSEFINIDRDILHNLCTPRASQREREGKSVCVNFAAELFCNSTPVEINTHTLCVHNICIF